MAESDVKIGNSDLDANLFIAAFGDIHYNGIHEVFFDYIGEENGVYSFQFQNLDVVKTYQIAFDRENDNYSVLYIEGGKKTKVGNFDSTEAFNGLFDKVDKVYLSGADNISANMKAVLHNIEEAQAQALEIGQKPLEKNPNELNPPAASVDALLAK